MDESFSAAKHPHRGGNPGQCLYCGYDLSGLSDDLRCPECGRQNIPDAYRREMQEIFDSPLRLYREALRVFSKHPPGWYWSLDRDGDVQRSFRLALFNIVLSSVIAFGALVLANIFVLRIVDETYLVDPTGDEAPVLTHRYTTDWGVFARQYDVWGENIIPDEEVEEAYRGRNWRYKRVRQIVCYPYFLNVWHIPAFFIAWIGVIWVMVTQVGMWTQIRKGLPPYARARRTIMAAGNCESCKFPFQALCFAGFMGLETGIRLGFPNAWPTRYLMSLIALGVLTSILVCISWVGPLRSDFTRQLIRSRAHAIRMFIMYVLILPYPIAAIILGAIHIASGGAY